MIDVVDDEEWMGIYLMNIMNISGWCLVRLSKKKGCDLYYGRNN